MVGSIPRRGVSRCRPYPVHRMTIVIAVMLDMVERLERACIGGPAVIRSNRGALWRAVSTRAGGNQEKDAPNHWSDSLNLCILRGGGTGTPEREDGERRADQDDGGDPEQGDGNWTRVEDGQFSPGDFQ